MVDKKYPRSKQKDIDHAINSEEAYTSWNDENGKAAALHNYTSSIAEFAAAGRSSYDNITTYQSGRPGLEKAIMIIFALTKESLLSPKRLSHLLENLIDK